MGERAVDVIDEAPPSYRRLFEIEGFPRLVSSMMLARTAGTMVGLILVLFSLDRYGSPTIAGLVTFLSIFPGLAVSPIAGALLDRHGRARLMILDYLVAATALTTIVVLGAVDALPVPLLLAIVTVQSLTFPLSHTGVRTLFPLLVPKPMWERANAIDSNGYVVATIFGPAIAGALVATVGSLWALALTAAMHLVAAAIALGVRDPIGQTAPGRLLADAWAGLMYVVRHPTLRALAISVSTNNVANGFWYIALPVLVLTRLGGGAAQVGQLFALQGVIAAISVLFFGRVSTEGRERRLMAGSMCVAALGLVVATLAPDLLVVAIAMAIIGLASGPYDIVLFTIRQRRTDPAWLGRAFAVSMSVNYMGFPIGSALGGAVTPVSIEAAFAIAVVLNVVAAATTAFVPTQHRESTRSATKA
jgi:MFS family permease